MADIIPNVFLKNQADKNINFSTDIMKVAFISGTYNEGALRTIHSYNQLSAYEVSAVYGYPQGGLPVGGKTVVVDTDKDELVYDMHDVGMTVSGGTFGPVRYGVLYDITDYNTIVYIFDFGADKTVNDGAMFKIKINDDGLMRAKQFKSIESSGE
jgi:hypothetical protein